MNAKCDLDDVRRLAMVRAQGKIKRLKAAGVPVSSETFGDLMKAGYEEAKAECAPASSELTEEQMALVVSECAPCAKRFTLKGKPKS